MVDSVVGTENYTWFIVRAQWAENVQSKSRLLKEPSWAELCLGLLSFVRLDSPSGCCGHGGCFCLSNTPRLFLTQGCYCATPSTCNTLPPGLHRHFLLCRRPVTIVLFSQHLSAPETVPFSSATPQIECKGPERRLAPVSFTVQKSTCLPRCSMYIRLTVFRFSFFLPL